MMLLRAKQMIERKKTLADGTGQLAMQARVSNAEFAETIHLPLKS